jgi:branched-chain amino acid transport system substrate-binding protein
MAEQLRKSFHILAFVALGFFVHCVKSGVIRQDQAPEKMQAQAAAQFKIAESQFQQGKLAQALPQFQAIAKKFFNTTTADNAMLRIAQIHKREKNLPLAEATLKKLLTTYPLSDVQHQTLRELVAIEIQDSKYNEALQHIVQIDLRKLSAKEQTALSTAASLCIQKTKREDLAFLWKISKSDVNSALQSEIRSDLKNISDKKMLVYVIEKRQNRFPALEASYELYRISRNENSPDSKKWAAYIVEHFPTSNEAQELRTEVSEPVPFTNTGGTYAIGVLLPLTGDQQNYGLSALNGIKAAVEVVKQSSPNQNIQLFIEDIGLGGDSAKTALQKLLVEHQIIAAIGPMSAKDTELVAPLAEANQLPIISLSHSENVTSFGSTTFRNNITKNEQAIALTQILTEIMGIKRAAILYPNNAYGKEFMELFWKEFEKKGGTIRGAEEYDRASSDYQTPIKKMVGLWEKDVRKNEICSKAQTERWNEVKKYGGQYPNCSPIELLPPVVDFEAVFIPDSYDKARQVVPTLLFLGVKGVQVMGTNLWNTNELLAGTTGNEIEGSMFLDGFFKGKQSTEVSTFMQKFYSMYGTEPGNLEAQGYESAMAIMHVIQKKGPSTRDAMVKHLLKLSDFKGVTGMIGFSDKRESVRNITALIIDQNKITELH